MGPDPHRGTEEAYPSEEIGRSVEGKGSSPPHADRVSRAYLGSSPMGAVWVSRKAGTAR